MNRNQARMSKSWTQAMAARNAKTDPTSGFSTLVNQITVGSNQVLKTRQGKSLYENEHMRECMQGRTAVPMLTDDEARSQLKRVIRNTHLVGTYESVSLNVPEKNSLVKNLVQQVTSSALNAGVSTSL